MNPDIIAQAKITLCVKLPGQLSPVEISMAISEHVAECARPLPRDRELPWAIEDRKEADKMMRLRRELAEIIAKRITESLLKAFAAKDPVNGYSPEECARMHQ